MTLRRLSVLLSCPGPALPAHRCAHRAWPLALAGLLLASMAQGAPRREAAPAEPPPLQLKDFAVQRPLTISGHDGVVQLTLPADAYPQINDPQMRDVRVFNARGEAMAFAWHTPVGTPQVADRQSATAIFPVRGATAAPAEGVEVSVTTRHDGTIIAAHSRQAGAAPSGAAGDPEGRGLQALILDLGPDADDETLLTLLFEPPAQAQDEDYRADLTVDVSTDLKQWDRVATAPVMWLRGVPAQAAAPLVQDRIDLHGLVAGHPRYARIQWLRGEPALFKQVQVLRRKSVEAPPRLEELVIEPRPGPRHAPQDWVYRAPPALAALQVGLRMPEANTVLPAAIGAYEAPAAPGRMPLFDSVTQNTFFRLTQAGQERLSGLVAISPQAHAEWVVRPLRPPAGGAAASVPPLPPAQAPRLVLRWQPATLVFAAQGPGPFVLALGATKPWGRPADTVLSQVAPGFSTSELQKLETAQVGAGATVVAASAPMDEPAAHGAVPAGRHRLVLWGVLLAGFGVLSFMCWTLYRQINAKPSDTPSTPPPAPE